MRCLSRLFVVSVAVAAVMVFAGGGAAMAAPPQAPQPGVMLTATSIQISPPQASFERAILTVAGPHRFHYQKVVNGGEPITFDATSITDKDGNAVNLADGRYKWELRVLVPAAKTQAISGGPTNDNDANSQEQGPELEATVYTGRFLIQGGSLHAVPNVDRLQRQARPVSRSQAATPSEGPPEPSPSSDGSITIQTTNPNGNHFSGDVTSSGHFGASYADGASVPYGFSDSEGVPGLYLDDTTDSVAWVLWTDLGTSTFRLRDDTTGTNPFMVEKATPSNTLYLDSTGNVGIGTSTPNFSLHVLASFPTFKLEDAGGGYLGLTTSSFSTFFRTKTATGSETSPIELFHGAPDASLVVQSSGNVGIGTNTPGEKVHVVGSAGADLRVRLDGPGGKHVENMYYDGATLAGRFIAATGNTAGNRYFGFIGYNDQDGNRLPIRFFTKDAGGTLRTGLFIGAGQPSGQGGYVGIGTATPGHPLEVAGGAYCTGTTWVNASSRAYKKDITELPADEALDVFKKLKPVTFEYKANPEEKHVGFIAEDVPDLVATADRKGIATMDIVGVLTKVVQQQQEEITELKARIARLEAGTH